MAYNESGELPVGQGYWLGNYSFELHVDQVHEPGEEDVVSVYAVCRHISPGGTQESRETQAVDFPAGTTVESWSVEANESEASVYASVKGNPVTKDVNLSEVGSMMYSYQSAIYHGIYWPNLLVWADFPARVFYDKTELNAQDPPPLTLNYYPEKDIWYGSIDIDGQAYSPIYGPVVETESDKLELLPQGHASEENLQTVLIGRFAIDLKEADGGPDGGWDEPGSVEPDPEDPQEPEQTHTLTLTAIAALSGRHNDPLDDTSYSYLPADNNTVKPYGCGGDGGHGGGGGGGASTMVVRKIATDKASHTEVVAHTKRHGYGSGGGKGGKGGDGCILVFW